MTPKTPAELSRNRPKSNAIHPQPQLGGDFFRLVAF